MTINIFFIVADCRWQATISTPPTRVVAGHGPTDHDGHMRCLPRNGRLRVLLQGLRLGHLRVLPGQRIRHCEYCDPTGLKGFQIDCKYFMGSLLVFYLNDISLLIRQSKLLVFIALDEFLAIVFDFVLSCSDFVEAVQRGHVLGLPVR